MVAFKELLVIMEQISINDWQTLYTFILASWSDSGINLWRCWLPVPVSVWESWGCLKACMQLHKFSDGLFVEITIREYALKNIEGKGYHKERNWPLSSYTNVHLIGWGVYFNMRVYGRLGQLIFPRGHMRNGLLWSPGPQQFSFIKWEISSLKSESMSDRTGYLDLLNFITENVGSHMMVDPKRTSSNL